MPVSGRLDNMIKHVMASSTPSYATDGQLPSRNDTVFLPLL